VFVAMLEAGYANGVQQCAAVLDPKDVTVGDLCTFNTKADLSNVTLRMFLPRRKQLD